ncbi:hypothetical protein RND81_10G166600 [Saponaria officinalis]|uniref:Uncharacterized protein n=1 Tax=Saponaria officinalis TaxID=3572 RepID=A0AAW1I5F2_SAPOF
MVDIKYIKTRVKTLAKSLGDLLLRHHTCHETLACQSLDVHVPVAWPKEYEFSCSSTPAATTSYISKSKRHYPCSFYYYNNHQSLYHNFRNWRRGKLVLCDEQKLKNFIEVGDVVDHGCVDKAADEFIERFYKQLKLQNVGPKSKEFR